MSSLGNARSAQQNIGGSVAKARSVQVNSVESEKNMPRGHTKVVKSLKGTSRLLNTLEVRLCRGVHKNTELLKVL